MSNLYCGTIKVPIVYFNSDSEHSSLMKMFGIKLPDYYHMVSNLKEYLSAAELLRAQRYHFEKDTNQFIISRALLKFILARYTGLSISKINIQRDKNNKPYISSETPVCFNVSHSEDYAIIVVSSAAVGIDVEYINKDFDFSEVLNYSFDDQDIETILKAENKVKTFFKFWTRKEAIVKATGKGIDNNLSKIRVMDGTHPMTSNHLGHHQGLTVLSFDLDENYVAAVAYDVNMAHSNQLSICRLPTTNEELMAIVNS